MLIDEFPEALAEVEGATPDLEPLLLNHIAELAPSLRLLDASNRFPEAVMPPCHLPLELAASVRHHDVCAHDQLLLFCLLSTLACGRD
eukprot:CAMPEP_0115765746 /NCGR_PEP_ID=MMETSP0272-20121206/102754_1 /TAXON_ID=71861 /ORGANISM="Scrippsiella trochoidea, Strain CCMP3099" /LENGTH=87 /DNA_ID=CAMNT_0003211613 /DNA_START=235 /DNA_END=498 /DNA_ORIENTATION=-